MDKAHQTVLNHLPPAPATLVLLALCSAPSIAASTLSMRASHPNAIAKQSLGFPKEGQPPPDEEQALRAL